MQEEGSTLRHKGPEAQRCMQQQEGQRGGGREQGGRVRAEQEALAAMVKTLVLILQETERRPSNESGRDRPIMRCMVSESSCAHRAEGDSWGGGGEPPGSSLRLSRGKLIGMPFPHAAVAGHCLVHVKTCKCHLSLYMLIKCLSLSVCPCGVCRNLSLPHPQI